MSMPIAIVGVGCRLPGGIVDPASFMRFIAERGDGIVPVPPDRWSLRRYFDPDPSVPGRTYTSHGGFLRQDVFAFEPEPFGISPREAATLDPQQALLLEVSWEALEDAGIALDRIAGSATGVYIGAFALDNQVFRLGGTARRSVGQHIATSVMATMMSARLAYAFDLHGPTLTVDTACSSSLVAIHTACRAIRAGECDAALAGGAHVMVLPGMMTALAKGRFASADGRSKAFDAKADGYGRGEGAAVVVLKPLQSAIAENDRIYGIIVGSAINQDGRTNGITVPSGAAQEALIRAACADAGVSPGQVGYVEAHGTGTPVGDPIEAHSLGRVYGACSMGSVKTNIGHLEAAAGVVGLVKACLMQRKGRVLPQRGPAEVGSDLGLDESGLRIATEEHAWPGMRPLAAVNSFGYGGTNAHVIVAPAPRRAHDGAALKVMGPTLVPLSAYSEAALRARAADVIQWIDGGGDAGDLGFTLARRRSHLTTRACVVAGSRAELRGALEALRDGRDAPEVVKGTAPAGEQVKTAWVFTGMGPQRAGMARELLDGEPEFRREVEACDALFLALSGWSILDVLVDPDRASSLARNDVAQVANFVVQAGLTALLESLGARPDAVVGHSVGEVGAAYAAGVMSRADAVLLVHHRARGSQSAAGQGTMLAAGVSADDAPFLIEPGDDACVAAINGPESVTFAGERAALTKIARVLDGLGVFQRMLPVEIAYHSAHLEPARAQLLRAWKPVRSGTPRVPLYSTVTGGRFEGEHDAAYWWRNLRQPVRFAEAARAMIADGYRMFLEVGPHPVLATNLRALLDAAGAPGQTLHTLERERPERLEVRRALAALHCNGVRVDWSVLHSRGSQVSLPAYPWQRAVHWKESVAMRTERLATDYVHPFLQTRLPTPNPSWISWLEGAAASYLRDHRVQDVPIAPAAFYVEAGLALARAIDVGASRLVLRHVRFEEPLPLEGETMVCVCADADGRFEVQSRVEGRDTWTMHASGEWATEDVERPSDAEPLASLRLRLVEHIDVDVAYEAMIGRQMQYGPAFRTVRELRRGAGEVLACLELPTLPEEARFAALLPPPLLDGVFQSLIALFPDDKGPVMVSGVGKLSLVGPVGTELSSHARVIAHDEKGFTAHVTLYGPDGAVVGHVRHAACRNLDTRSGFGEAKRWLYAQRWQPLDIAADLPGGAWAFYGDAGLAASLVERLRVQHRDASHRPDAAFDPLAAHHVVLLDPRDDMFAALSGVGALAHRLRAGGWSELTLITLEAVRARDDDTVSPAMAACWGFARALEREVSPLRLRLIDAAPGADLGEVATALCIDGEDEVAVRGGVLYTARLEHLDLASLRVAADPATSCVAWSAEHSWVCLSPPRPRRVRIERVVIFGAGLVVSIAFDPDTRERGVVITEGAPPTEVHVAPSTFWRIETDVTPSQLAAAVGHTVAHRLLHVPAGGAVWVAPSLTWLAACFDAAGVPRAGSVHAWVVSTPNELEAAPLQHSADVGVVGVVSASGDEPPRWSALPNGWNLTRLRPAALHAKDLVENLPPGDVAAPIATRPFVELAAPIVSTPQAFDVSHQHIDALDLRTLRVNADDTWWITGGTRGFGFAIAQWLVEHGAKRLVLSGRSGRMRDDDRARLEATGARVDVCPLDVGDSDAVKAFVAALEARGTPPTAIVHAAAQYEAAPVEQMDRALFERVFRAKALGAWHLHEATRDLRIDHFILCSSVVALLGNPVQTAYAAANAYLDGLASLRCAQGLAARSIAWGALADVGILAREEATAREIKASGLRGMKARDAWGTLAAIPPSAPENVAIFDGDWPQIFRALRLVPRARWEALQPAEDAVASCDRIAAMLHGVEPAQHLDVVGAAVRERAAAVLRTAADQIDPARPLRDYGLDSLLAVELRVALDSHLGVDLPTLKILAGASARDLARAALRLQMPINDLTPEAS